jgi:hypothetical protein
MTHYRYRWECEHCQTFGRWHSSGVEARRDFWAEHRRDCLLEDSAILKKDLLADDQETR